MTAEPSTERAPVEQIDWCCAVVAAEDIDIENKIRLLHSVAHHYWSLLQEVNQRVGELVEEARGH